MVTLVNQSSPFLDTVVLDVIGTWSCIISDQLEYQVTMCGPNELEFLLVSVHNTMLMRKCILAYGTGHLLIQLH